MVIKAIVFDCFGVLITPGKFLLYHDYHKCHEQIVELERQSDCGLISRRQFNEAIAQLIGMTTKEVKSKYYDTDVINSDAINWVRELKTSGKYKIGLLSNVGHGWLDDFLYLNGMSDLFDEILLSGDVGIVKPSPEIFKLMTDNLKLDPRECIMIDDMIQNVEGAEAIGMKGVVFSNTDQAKSELQLILDSNNA